MPIIVLAQAAAYAVPDRLKGVVAASNAARFLSCAV
jgi:hypothetical protein